MAIIEPTSSASFFKFVMLEPLGRIGGFLLFVLGGASDVKRTGVSSLLDDPVEFSRVVDIADVGAWNGLCGRPSSTRNRVRSEAVAVTVPRVDWRRRERVIGYPVGLLSNTLGEKSSLPFAKDVESDCGRKFGSAWPLLFPRDGYIIGAICSLQFGQAGFVDLSA